MDQKSNKTQLKFSFKKVLLWLLAGIIFVLTGAGIFLYHNFNRLLSDALKNSFNSTLISDVYELSFKDLNVNFILGNIKVNNVVLQPREKPLKDYPYINSSFRFSTKEILLNNVEIYTLLKQNRLRLKRVKIENPAVEITIANEIPVFLPFKDTVATTTDTVKQTEKRPIEGFFLEQFDLMDASIRAENFAKERNLQIDEVDITLVDLKIDQKPGKDLFSYSYFDFYIGKINGSLQKESVKKISLSDYEIIIDSMKVEKTIDTLIYDFYDFQLGLKNLDIQTADSIFHITLEDFNLSYSDKSILLKNIAFNPNISETALQKRNKFQITQFVGNVGLLNINGIGFDSLFQKKKLFIDEILIDSVSAKIFKDKTKPIDLKKFPEYLGQTVAAIKLPLLIKQVKATNVNLINREYRPDSSYATANINKATMSVENFTNIDIKKPLIMKADAYLENKVRFQVTLGFDYKKPEFSIKGSFPKFNLKDLNPLIQSYTPVTVNSGQVDVIEFTGTAGKTSSSGTMKFLYHDLNIDIKLDEKAAWKNSVISFAANRVVASANPVSEKLPPKIVKFSAERDMNKGFINIVIKSALNGLKETILMSKENKKAYKEEKKKARRENKK